MASRLSLQTKLETALGTRHVYYQPPESLRIEYPAIIYTRDLIRTRYANNTPYNINKGYTLTLIYKDPDSTIPNAISELPMCSFDRHYIADNLIHDVFTIYW